MLALASRCLTASKGDSEENLGGCHSSPNWLLRQMRPYQISFLRTLLQDRSTILISQEPNQQFAAGVFCVCSKCICAPICAAKAGADWMYSKFHANSSEFHNFYTNLEKGIPIGCYYVWFGWLLALKEGKTCTKTAGQESGSPEPATLFRSIHPHHQFLVVLCYLSGEHKGFPTGISMNVCIS